MANTGAASRGGNRAKAAAKKGGGVLTPDERAHECFLAIQRALEFYRCELGSDIDEDAEMWIEAITDERLN